MNPAPTTRPATVTLTIPAAVIDKVVGWQDRMVRAMNSDVPANEKRELAAVRDEVSAYFWGTVVPAMKGDM